VIFSDREEAGRRLAHELLRFKDQDPVVVALVRGGVPVAYEVVQALHAPLDIALVRKLGTPFNPELAMGAVVDGDEPEIVTNPEILQALRISKQEVEKAAQRQLAEIERRRALYLGNRPRPEITGKTAIVVDDGVATGATTRAALHALRRKQPARLVLAVPVAPPDSIKALEADADEIVCLATPESFGAISLFYGHFAQVSDEEVIRILDRAAAQDWHSGQK